MEHFNLLLGRNQGAGFEPNQAKAMINALTPSSNELVTKDILKAEINGLKSQIIMWMVGLHIATVSLVVALLS